MQGTVYLKNQLERDLQSWFHTTINDLLPCRSFSKKVQQVESQLAIEDQNRWETIDSPQSDESGPTALTTERSQKLFTDKETKKTLLTNLQSNEQNLTEGKSEARRLGCDQFVSACKLLMGNMQISCPSWSKTARIGSKLQASEGESTYSLLQSCGDSNSQSKVGNARVIASALILTENCCSLNRLMPSYGCLLVVLHDCPLFWRGDKSSRSIWARETIWILPAHLGLFCHKKKSEKLPSVEFETDPLQRLLLGFPPPWAQHYRCFQASGFWIPIKS